MPPKNTKRPKPGTPEKQEKCAVSGCRIEQNGRAIECNECSRWLCLPCLDLSDDEYDLFLKMNRRLDSSWKCPLCKAGGSKPNEITSSIQSTLNEHCKKIQDILDSRLDAFQHGMEATVNSLTAKMGDLEVSLRAKVTAEDVVAIVESSVAAKLADVRLIVRQEQDRFNRRLNIICHGVPPQTDDTLFLSTFIKKQFAIDAGPISNTRRVPVTQSKNTTSTPMHKPILFSVSSFKTKIEILKASRVAKGDVQFYADASWEDRRKHRELVEQIKRRSAAGETNLGIRNGVIITKNEGDPAPRVPRPNPTPMD